MGWEEVWSSVIIQELLIFPQCRHAAPLSEEGAANQGSLIKNSGDIVSRLLLPAKGTELYVVYSVRVSDLFLKIPCYSLWLMPGKWQVFQWSLKACLLHRLKSVEYFAFYSDFDLQTKKQVCDGWGWPKTREWERSDPSTCIQMLGCWTQDFLQDLMTGARKKVML